MLIWIWILLNPQKFVPRVPEIPASETWSFSLPWKKSSTFQPFFSHWTHISKEALHRTQINKIGKFPAAAIEEELGSRGPQSILFGLQRSLYDPVPFCYQERNWVPVTCSYPLNKLVAGPGLETTSRLPTQSLSRPWAAAHGASSPGVFRQPLCLGIFCLSTDACHLVQRSIHSAISAVNT